MALILAIDPEGQQGGALERLGRELGDPELVAAASCADALAAIDRRLPDLVLLSPFLPEAEEGELLSRLRALSGTRDVPALTIPLLKSAARAPAARAGRRFRRGGPSKKASSAEGCEPRVFADRIREHLDSVEIESPDDDFVDGRSADVPSPGAGVSRSGFQVPSFAQPDRRARVMAAAHAAASWARARRAGWDETPVEVSQTAAVEISQTAANGVTFDTVDWRTSPVLLDRVEHVAPALTRATTKRSSDAVVAASPALARETEMPIQHAPVEDAGPSVLAKAAARARSLVTPIARWLPVVADVDTADWRAEPVSLDSVEHIAPALTPATTKLSSDTVAASSPALARETETPIQHAPVEDAGPSALAKAAARARSLVAPIARWLPVVTGVALLVTLGLMGHTYWQKTVATPKTGRAVLESVPPGSQVVVDGRTLGTTPMTATLSAGSHALEFRFRKATRTMTLAVAAGGQTVERVDWTRKPTGGLFVTSEPVSAKVLIDGITRGVTPLTIDDLGLGVHTVLLESPKGSVQRSVTIKAGETARLVETIFAGWLTVFSPFELTITEGTRTIRLDERHQVMLAPGPHELRLENRALGFHEVRRVDLQPGGVTALSIVPPRSALTVIATAPAEVWLDRVHVGQTPLLQLPVDLGTREVIVKSAAGEERRFTVTVTVQPATFNIDFSKPMS